MFHLIGLDTVKVGLHIYFDKFQWGNTTLKDFIDSLYAAYKESQRSKE